MQQAGLEFLKAFVCAFMFTLRLLIIGFEFLPATASSYVCTYAEACN